MLVHVCVFSVFYCNPETAARNCTLEREREATMAAEASVLRLCCKCFPAADSPCAMCKQHSQQLTLLLAHFSFAADCILVGPLLLLQWSHCCLDTCGESAANQQQPTQQKWICSRHRGGNLTEPQLLQQCNFCWGTLVVSLCLTAQTVTTLESACGFKQTLPQPVLLQQCGCCWGTLVVSAAAAALVVSAAAAAKPAQCPPLTTQLMLNTPKTKIETKTLLKWGFELKLISCRHTPKIMILNKPIISMILKPKEYMRFA